jgi:transcriptional regulator with XRE-family HTH domain
MAIELPLDTAIALGQRSPFPKLRRRRGWRPPRLDSGALYAHLLFWPTARQLQYLEAYRRVLSRKQRPTLAQLADLLGVTRQTVWQLEQNNRFRKWLVTELHLWREGNGFNDSVGCHSRLKMRRRRQALSSSAT